jgi:hypothetical protein
MIQDVRRVLVRDLEALRVSLRAYPTESMIWMLPPGISNSAGTLALHMVGNLQHFIGAQLGGTGYVRDRIAEFSDRDVPLGLIEHRIDVTINALKDTLDHMDGSTIDDAYPLDIGGQRLSTRLFLTHLVSHAGYHLGQIDYHRRLITGINRPVGPSIKGLTEGQ